MSVLRGEQTKLTAKVSETVVRSKQGLGKIQISSEGGVTIICVSSTSLRTIFTVHREIRGMRTRKEMTLLRDIFHETVEEVRNVFTKLSEGLVRVDVLHEVQLTTTLLHFHKAARVFQVRT